MLHSMVRVCGQMRRGARGVGCGGSGVINPSRSSSSCSEEKDLFSEAEMEVEDSSEEGSFYLMRRRV